MAVSPLAWAGPMDDAQVQLGEAYNNYYSSYRQGGADQSHAKELSDKIIGPAYDAVSSAQGKEFSQMLSKVGVLFAVPNPSEYADPKAPFATLVDPSDWKRFLASKDKPVPVNDIAPVGTAGLLGNGPKPAIEDPQPSAPGAVIDGSDFPKEVQYPGKQKKKSP